MRLEQSVLNIDSARVAHCIEGHIRQLIDVNAARGVLIGLSGGLDSGVLAALAVRAMGRESVHVFYLYDRDSGKELERRARLVANWLGLELATWDIEPAMRERGIYASLVMHLCSLSCFVNRYLLHNLYLLGFGESPFLTTLHKGGDEFSGGKLKEWVYSSAVRYVEAAFSARHIYRREVLEKRAQSQKWLLLSAANRSEWLTGWFVKGGIDDMPLSPIQGLYKTQVRKLAVYLGIPSEIRTQTPSPDMMKGITDEFAMGVSYRKIDIISAGIERGLPDEEIIPTGVTRKEIHLVRQMNRLSRWKRESQHDEPPSQKDWGY